jgi:limonene-1,2-epoxide hydrolase
MTMTPTETVTAFLKCWSDGMPALYRALYEYLAPDAVWENIGVSRTVGPAEAEACFRSFEPMQTCLRMDVEILTQAAQGNTVLNERIDRVIGPDGREMATVRAMGTFVVQDGRITEWRDYFDTLPFAGQGPAAAA